MKVIAALQPGYLPWLGYFDLMKRSDVFVVEDSLKYTKQDWRNRNRIRTENGFAYLTVPVKKGAEYLPIRDVEIDNSQPWARRHWSLLFHNYRNAPQWDTYAPFFKETYTRSWSNLLELDLWVTAFVAKEFGIDTETILLSELGVTFGPDKTQSLVDLLRALDGSVFLEGASGKGFITPATFEKNGLAVRFQDYICHEYPQQFQPFVSHLSCVDLLLNVGPQGRDLI